MNQVRILQFAEKNISSVNFKPWCHLEVLNPKPWMHPAGLNATDVLAALKAAHAGGRESAGLDVETGEPADLYKTQGIVDLYMTKWWALRLASDAAVTVLKVDQIIMVRQGLGCRQGYRVQTRVSVSAKVKGPCVEFRAHRLRCNSRFPPALSSSGGQRPAKRPGFGIQSPSWDHVHRRIRWGCERQ